MEATCPICMEPFTATELRSLTGGRCGHRHCGECLGGYLAAKVGSHEASEAQMHCPECATPGAVGDIEALLLQHVERGGSPTPSPAEPRCEGPRLVEVMVDATAAVAEGQPVEAEELARGDAPAECGKVRGPRKQLDVLAQWRNLRQLVRDLRPPARSAPRSGPPAAGAAM
jgi:hypothetical protein